MRQWISKTLIAAGILCVVYSVPARTETYRAAEYPLEMTVPDDWEKREPEYESVLVAYASKESGEFLNIIVREIDPGKSVDDLTWVDLFSPHYDQINIKTQGYTYMNGKRAKFCLYSIVPGDFKQQLEGTLDLMHLNYVVIHEGRLYSIIFSDAIQVFMTHYPIFMKIASSMKFGA